MQFLTLEQFRATQDSGGVLSVTLMADGPGFEVQIETRRGLATLVKTRDKASTRRFVDPRKALMLLREVGIHEARIAGQQWRPDEQALERKPRPDRAEAMKAAHQALSHEKTPGRSQVFSPPSGGLTQSERSGGAHSEWLTSKLTRSAADARPRVPHDEAMSKVQAIIDSKKLQANDAKTAT